MISAAGVNWCVKGKHEMVCGQGIDAFKKTALCVVSDWSSCAVGCDRTPDQHFSSWPVGYQHEKEIRQNQLNLEDRALLLSEDL